ncbi:MAG: threonine--tRNA ligase [archaeon]
MKTLIQHCDYVKFKVTKKTKLAQEIPKELEQGEVKECLFVRFATEKEDDGNEKELAKKVVEDLKGVAEQVKVKKVLLYPYVHLLYGSEPSNVKTALSVQDLVEDGLKEDGFEVFKAPFGWYKEFEMKCKGHPLSELSRIIRAGDLVQKKEGSQELSEALKVEEKIKSKFYIIEPNGKKHEIVHEAGEIKGFDFSKHPKLEKLCKYELAKSRVSDKAPPHIEIMRKLELADYEPGSDPGNLRFYPNGRLIKSLLEDYVTRETVAYGAMEVEAPIMYDYEQPTLKKYIDRFPARQYVVETPNKNCFLRFAACLGQFLMAHDATISYKDLPLRMYEMTRYSFRVEKRGELSGLRRLRAFTMPDCHAFCADVKTAITEMQTRYKLAGNIQKGIGFEKDDMEISLRVVKEFENDLKPMVDAILKEWKKPIMVEEWDKRFFYFIFKHEWNFIDALDKAACLTTDQIDVENAETYDLKYTGEDGKEHRPVILHLSPSGSIERVMYALLEKAYMQAKTGKKAMLPVWLSPSQVRVCAVSDEYVKLCEKIADMLDKECIRVDIDDRSESVGKKISQAEQDWVPYTLVIGDQEAKSKKIPVRVRKSGKVEEMALEELVKVIKKETECMPYRRLSLPKYLSKRPKFVG